MQTLFKCICPEEYPTQIDNNKRDYETDPGETFRQRNEFRNKVFGNQIETVQKTPDYEG